MRKTLTSTILFVWVLFSCTPNNVNPSPTSPPPMVSKTTPPTSTPVPTKEIIQNKIVSGTPSPNAIGIEYVFDSGTTEQEKEIVRRAVNLGYNRISRLIEGDPIPSTAYIMKDCIELSTSYNDFLKAYNETRRMNNICNRGALAQRDAFFILLRKDTTENPDRLAAIVIHEYFHTVQYFFAWNGLPNDQRTSMPTWIVEGSADFYALDSLQSIDSLFPNESWANRENRLQINAVKLMDIIDDPQNDQEAYWLGSLAIRRIVDIYGFESFIDFLKLIRQSENWRTAFESTFNITPELFSKEFEANRALAFPHLTPTAVIGQGKIYGTILKENGQSIKGVWVFAWDMGKNKPIIDTYTDISGGFTFDLPEGNYRIEFGFKGEDWLGFYHNKEINGVSLNQDEYTKLTVTQGTVIGDIDITIPTILFSPKNKLYPCGVDIIPIDDGGIYSISGTMISQSSKSLTGWSISACPYYGNCEGGDVIHGKFTITVPNGIYSLGINEPIRNNDTPPIGWYAGNNNLMSEERSCEGSVVVNTADIADIQILIP